MRSRSGSWKQRRSDLATGDAGDGNSPFQPFLEQQMVTFSAKYDAQQVPRNLGMWKLQLEIWVVS